MRRQLVMAGFADSILPSEECTRLGKHLPQHFQYMKDATKSILRRKDRLVINAEIGRYGTKVTKLNQARQVYWPPQNAV